MPWVRGNNPWLGGVIPRLGGNNPWLIPGNPELGGISPLNLVISNPPTQVQVQTIVERFNQLLEALKRV